MEAHFQDWLSLVVRWIHFITGVAWIGASFYFNWLENHLERQHKPDHIAGDLWAVHGGGFYYLKKFQVAPERLPEPLHWFKWEAYGTWLSGIALLTIVYYFNARAFMIDPAVADLSEATAIAIGLGSLLLSWLVYDLLCRSPLARHGVWLALIIFAYFTLLAWGLSQWLSGRAAFIHVGAAVGTVMVANVFRVIIPAQKELVDAVAQRRPPDATKGKHALLRSRHNNYFTLPVLFIMISSHYPMTYGHTRQWLLLAAIAAIGVGVRHYFNIRHLPQARQWILPAAIIALLGLAAATLPRAPEAVATEDKAAIQSAEVMPVIKQRCSVCHSAEPSFAGFPAAPAGVTLDSVDDLEVNAAQVYQAVANKTMPLGNLTEMSEQERQLLLRWYQGLQQE